jgi:hypothetical protein
MQPVVGEVDQVVIQEMLDLKKAGNLIEGFAAQVEQGENDPLLLGECGNHLNQSAHRLKGTAYRD